MYDSCEPELMYLGNPILTTPDELFQWGAERLNLALNEQGNWD